MGGPTVLTVAHSPDADDAFMFYALTHGKVTAQGLSIRHELADIETLNRRAMEEARYDVTAISVHACAYVCDRYRIMTCGASVGDGYGPVLVAARPVKRLEGVTVAVPGTLTTATLALGILHPGCRHVVMPFDRIMEAVVAGEIEAGLLIHEGQLTYADFGLTAVADLGRQWKEATGLVLPLGVNAIRADLDEGVAARFAAAFRRAVDWALSHREEALGHAFGYGRGVDERRGDRFVAMYVNEFTRELGEAGRRAIETLLDMGSERGLVARRAPLRYLETPVASGADTRLH